MKVLNSFGPAFGLPDASPFCLKAMCLLNLSGTDWENNPGSDIRKAPMQKLPVLIDGDKIVADSDAIRAHLEESAEIDFDSPLDTKQRAISRSIIRMVEEHLYFCVVYDRWKLDSSWEQLKDNIFSDLPKPLKYFIPRIVRRSVLSNLHGQGIGRFSYDDMLIRAAADLQSLESMLDEGPFLFGQEPTAADASVGSMLISISVFPENTLLKQRIHSSEILMKYIGAIKTNLLKCA